MAKFLELTVCAPPPGSTVNKPYWFHAENASGDIFPVKMVVLAGGDESGLYRYPQQGETVLTAQEGDGSDAVYYHIGYVPSPAAKASFSGKAGSSDSTAVNVTDKNGMVLRYKKQGGNTADSTHSEIGFYKEMTKWKSAADIAGDTNPPHIDRLNIQSTGDRYDKTQNYQQIQAKRLEIAVNTNPSFSTKAGDLNIRTAGNITLNAGGSITLRSGRSSIQVSDNKIYLCSMIASGFLPSGMDADMSIAPTGITAGGRTLKLSAVNGFSIGDAFGGSFSSKIGVARVGGTDVKMETSDPAAYTGSVIQAGKNTVLNALIVGLADMLMDKGYGHSSDTYTTVIGIAAGTAFGPVEAAIKAIKEVMWTTPPEMGPHTFEETAFKDAAKEYKDIAGGLAASADLICSIAGTVTAILISAAPIILGEAQKDNNWTAEQKSKATYYYTSGLQLALMITEGTTNAVAAAAIAASKMVGAFVSHRGILHLQANAQTYMEAPQAKVNTMVEGRYTAPVAGATMPNPKAPSSKAASIAFGVVKSLSPLFKFYSDETLSML